MRTHPRVAAAQMMSLRQVSFHATRRRILARKIGLSFLALFVDECEFHFLAIRLGKRSGDSISRRPSARVGFTVAVHQLELPRPATTRQPGDGSSSGVVWVGQCGGYLSQESQRECSHASRPPARNEVTTSTNQRRTEVPGHPCMARKVPAKIATHLPRYPYTVRGCGCSIVYLSSKARAP